MRNYTTHINFFLIAMFWVFSMANGMEKRRLGFLDAIGKKVSYVPLTILYRCPNEHKSYCVAYAPTQKKAAISEVAILSKNLPKKNIIKILDSTTGKLLHEITTSLVDAMKFSLDGMQLALRIDDQNNDGIIIWDLILDKLLGFFPAHLAKFEFYKNSQILIGEWKKDVFVLWNTAKKHQKITPLPNTDYTDITCSNGKKYLALIDRKDNCAIVHDGQNLSRLKKFNLGSQVWHAPGYRWSNDNAMLIVPCQQYFKSSQSIKIWDMTNGKELSALFPGLFYVQTNCNEPLIDYAWSIDDNYIFIASFMMESKVSILKFIARGQQCCKEKMTLSEGIRSILDSDSETILVALGRRDFGIDISTIARIKIPENVSRNIKRTMTQKYISMKMFEFAKKYQFVDLFFT